MRKYALALLILTGCAHVDNGLVPPRFSPPISDYHYGDLAIVNTNGSQYNGFFDGKLVKVVGTKDSIVECELVHGDHIDTLRLEPRDLIKENK